MSISDAVYRPFETLIRPLDIPYQPLPTKGPVAVLMHFIRIFRGVIIAMALTSMAVEAINLIVIWGLSVIVDGVATQGVGQFVDSRFWLLVFLAVLIFPVMPIVFYITNILNSHTVGISLPIAIQWQGHKAIEGQDLAFFHDLFAGQVASRLGQVANAVQQQILIAFQTAPRFLLQIVGSVLLLLALSWQLALPVVAWVIVNVLFTLKVVPDFTERARRSARQNSLVSGAMTDIYGNIQMVKQFAAEDTEAGALRKIMARAVNTQHHEQRIYRTTELVVITLNMVLWLVMLGIGFWGLFDRFLTVGEFVAMVYILQRLSAGSFTFIQMGQQIFKALGTIRDAMPVMTTPPTITDRPGAKQLIVRHGEIRFENVQFAYKSDKGVIDDLSLTVRAGEKVGLVGLSGAGKTTVVNLLLRFYDIHGGAIHIDGQDIRAVSQASLRQNIGVIAQDVALLHRSVGDNIRYGRPEATSAEIEQAAQAAQADSFIADLTDGEGRKAYEAFVGDRGVKLSGGQRQRVSIARVLLKNAPILILDEATSALDSEAEAAIQEKLNLLMEGKTVIAIAHRLSTISRMDRIIVLDRGRIVEEGTPDALIEQDGLYARLWKRQTGGFIPGDI
ncbi:putative multidrug export ATP-binding/permease protein [Ensifer sp. M14]|uniref:ABC transporter ATP-binding protein n=1 Tax=Sinorhizobium/Ensifer group TaxID=227292 RepID=UPI00098592DB|nr:MULTISPECIES: ABC transporter ATP-binding protein [Sinorhizobium/Ensifer group]OOG72897.1 multidrug ABC transporter ATP-binding protein [Sinorhizobium sp. A49]RDL46896.1 putative multidrug export ATP-binding/permease protein [Ensifer sp. M14]